MSSRSYVLMLLNTRVRHCIFVEKLEWDPAYTFFIGNAKIFESLEEAKKAKWALAAFTKLADENKFFILAVDEIRNYNRT